jgi:RNA polymerase sigma-70 factor (family 1)
MIRKLHSEKELFLRTAGGDEDAFELLFGMYQAKLYDFALRLLKSHDAATELVQETFLKIWMSRETLVSVEQPESFIFTIIRNKAIDHLRKVAQDDKLRHHLWQQINVLRNSTEEEYFAKESDKLVEEACQRLSPQKQTIFRMSRYEGLNHEQIASQLHISKNTVKNHLVSSLRFIREHIARHSEAMILLMCLLF